MLSSVDGKIDGAVLGTMLFVIVGAPIKGL
jgi:hypothetical protein